MENVMEKTLTKEEAVKIANEIQRLEAILQEMKEQLKAYVRQNGALETESEKWDFYPSVQWEFTPESLREFCEGLIIEGKNPWEYLGFSASALKKLGYGEEVLLKYAERKETRRFLAKKNDFVVIECYACCHEFPVPLENDRIPGCVRCPFCGQRTCGE
ncbi:hypothetical protein BSNK01_04740 [Bacillaceae bacterium]